MKPSAITKPSVAPENSRRSILLASLLLATATIVAYSNSFNGPFVFDDIGTILNNPTIFQLWPPWAALAGPPGGTTASGRPIINLSLALNHALGGFDVRGYHAFNLGIHLAAALTLFGVVRRTFLRAPFRQRFGSVALPAAFACAALWALHPLQTAAITYLVQRAEALAALFYLLTLYGFIRATDSAMSASCRCGSGLARDAAGKSPASRPLKSKPNSWGNSKIKTAFNSIVTSKPLRWQILSVASCLFGMASKEIIVSAPLFVLLYDRTLVAGSFSEAWRRRRSYYLALASTWLVLVLLVIRSGSRDGSVGLAETITPWSYALTQCRAIAHYLRLTVWPSPLIFDYGTAFETNFIPVLPQALLLAALVGATGLAIWKRSPLGLAGAWFFAILAPSSSIVPIVTQTMAEHRMYLPLAAVICLLVGGAVAAAGPRSLWVILGAAALFGGFTFRRNAEYRTEVSIWRDTTAKLPDSKRAHVNLGTALYLSGDSTGAMAEFQAAVDLDPRYLSALTNLGLAQLQNGRPTDAAKNFAASLAIDPQNADAQAGYGFVLASEGRLPEAITHYREAIRYAPAFADYRLKLAQALFRARQLPEAVEQFRSLLQLAPELVEAHTGLGTALAASGQFDEASRELTEALRLKPDDADAHFNLANVFIEQGRIADAVPHYEQVLRLRPDNTSARQNLELAREYLRETP